VRVSSRSVVMTEGALALFVLFLSPAASAQPADAPPPRLQLGASDAVVTGGSVILAGVGKFLLNYDTQTVPPEGLDRETISLGWDRRALGRASTGSRTASDAFLAVSFPLPGLFNLYGGGPWLEDRERRLWRNQAEAVLAAAAVTTLIKPLSSRPRPFAYLSEAERPSGAAYDVTVDRAFESFPSGHATVAWASAISGIGYLATERPDLPPLVHFLAGMAGAGVATSTALLRVDAGQHFPSDVAAGSAIGAASGLGITLLHAGQTAGGPPRGKAWRSSLLGVAAGVGVALLLTPPTSPWID
jgi:membrane-associated phospholipid phosphatase